MENWRNDIDAIATKLGIDQPGNWRNDLHAIREAVEAGGGGSGGGTTPEQVQQIVDNSLTAFQATTSNIEDKAVTKEKIADGVLQVPLVATVCPATTVVFAFSDDGSTFSFTGGTFAWLSSKNNYGTAVFGAQINIPYITGRVIVLDVTNPSIPTVSSRSISSITFSENEYVIGNMFNVGTNPITRTVTVYGSGAYTWSAVAGPHEAYGDISTSGTSLDLVIGDYTIRALNNGSSASVSVLATNSDVPNVDLRRYSIYNDSSEGASFDNVTLTATPTVVDDTVLMQSNDSCTIWIGNGRQLIEAKVFISGGGARTRIVSNFLSS